MPDPRTACQDLDRIAIRSHGSADSRDFKVRDARSYDATTAAFDHFSSRLSTPLAERMIELAGLQPGERVLDVGTGTGLVARAAGHRVGPRGRVLGIDLSEGMVARATARAREAGLAGHVTFRVLDAERLPLEDQSFDVVLSLFALLHFPDPRAALGEWFRVLRPGGRLVLGIGSGPPLASPAGLVHLLRRLYGLVQERSGKRRSAPAALDRLVRDRLPGGEPEETAWSAGRGRRRRTVHRLIREAGFVSLRSCWQGHQAILATPEEFWDVQATFSSFARKRLLDAPPAAVGTLRQQCLARWRQMQARGGRLVYPFGAFFTVAQRPHSARSTDLAARVVRHARLSLQAAWPGPRQTPPFLIVFLNSVCNLTCEHCFYWRNLNRRDDLTYEEFRRLAEELGPFENLNLSGGEPFLRPDFAAICSLFLRNNAVQRIYVPTNGYYPERTVEQVRAVLRAPTLRSFACELSLDGTPAYHNRFRGNPHSFARALATYDALAAVQRDDPRLRIHAVSTATADNLDELRELTSYLFERCPAMDHHNLALLRGDPKNPALRPPPRDRYADLYRHFAAVWKEREKGRFGAIVEPLLQWAKCKTVATGMQYVPCTAGRLTGVIHANGDVAVCETHPPLGNLRRQSFFEIWDSPQARALRARIQARECHCTNEVFLWPSIVFQPVQLARVLVGARAEWGGTSKTRRCLADGGHSTCKP